MPIQIYVENEMAGPVAVCDFCGDRITDALDGNALWLECFSKGERVPDKRIVFTHKRCNMRFERANPAPADHHWMANGLEVFMAYMISNLKLEPEDAKRTANFLSRVG